MNGHPSAIGTVNIGADSGRFIEGEIEGLPKLDAVGPPGVSGPARVSIVVPVYRSEQYLARTVDRILAAASDLPCELEVVLVNDASPDGVWPVIEGLVASDERIVGVSLSRNYGQHVANIVGFRYATGDCVITMDDDLQNPPEEIASLLSAWSDGHDLVIGSFVSKQHARIRSLGSSTMQLLNRRVFDTPDDLILTNFRLIDRSIIERINRYNTPAPYTTGLAVMFASNPTNVMVEHHQRTDGVSNYNLWRLGRLAWSILFNYSNLPIRALVAMGVTGSLAAFGVALLLIVKALVAGSGVPGWTSLALIISLGNGLILAVLSVIGEYLLLMVRQLSSHDHFHVRTVARRGAPVRQGGTC